MGYEPLYQSMLYKYSNTPNFLCIFILFYIFKLFFCLGVGL